LTISKELVILVLWLRIKVGNFVDACSRKPCDLSIPNSIELIYTKINIV
jgi:hypothetical protein